MTWLPDAQGGSRSSGVPMQAAFVLLLLFVTSVLLGGAVSFGVFPLIPILLLPALLAILAHVGDERQMTAFAVLLAFLALVTLILWPRYAYLRFGGLPGLTPSRAILAVWIVVWISCVLRFGRFRSNFADRLKASKPVSWLVFLLSLLTLASALVGGGGISAFIGATNSVLMLAGVYFMAMTVLCNEHRIALFLRAVGVASLTVVAVSAAEVYLGRNLFQSILPVSDDYALQALASKVRDAGYRAQSTFDHPLTFAQYLVTTLPLVVALFLKSRTLLSRVVWLGLLAGMVVSVFLTHTRSAVFTLVVSASFFFFYFFVGSSISRRISPKLLLAGVGCLSISVFLAGYFSGDLYELLVGRTQAEASSTNARLTMFERSVPIVFEQPFLGHGFGRAAELVGIVGANRILTVDSMLISFAVESGVFALASYILIVVFGLIRTIQSVRNGGDIVLGAAFGTSIFAFFVTTVGLSLSGNFFLMAFLLAGLAGLPMRREHQ